MSKKKLITKSAIAFVTTMFLYINIVSAQSVSQVLEEGVPVGEHSYLFLKYFDGAIHYDINKDGEKFHWKKVKKEEEPIFLSKSNAIIVLLKPFNPLLYNYSDTLFFRTNTIDSSGAVAVAELTKFLSTTINPAALAAECNNLNNLISVAKHLDTLLSEDQKGEIEAVFNDLKAINFEKKDETEQQINDIKNGSLKAIQAHFKKLSEDLTKFQKAIGDYTPEEGCLEKFIVQNIFSNVLKDFKVLKAIQEKRFENLNKCYLLVASIKDKANSSVSSIPWTIDLKPIEFEKGKVSVFKFSINNSDYVVSDHEITTSKGKELSNASFNVRPFKRFIIEVSGGVAYTWLTFPKFGTSTDAQGQQIVSQAGNDNLRRLNFTTLINWNYFVKNSHVNPFFQAGGGLNAGYPVLLFGGGFRFGGIAKVPAFAISGGLASSWVKSLDKLKLGDKVSGTSDVEKDIKYSFNWPPKLYIGFQFQL